MYREQAYFTEITEKYNSKFIGKYDHLKRSRPHSN
jgi:hypothetical protein